ncbi:hypothetical protein [Kribbella capetownensis]|uniref:hypothetical protein n=1 Tax=Kribbella capetownensis TaxID=1572659 RepID=UPI0013F3FAF9|nr:hypothetical protein [Kribbella capetownensis]
MGSSVSTYVPAAFATVAPSGASGSAEPMVGPAPGQPAAAVGFRHDGRCGDFRLLSVT